MSPISFTSGWRTPSSSGHRSRAPASRRSTSRRRSLPRACSRSIPAKDLAADGLPDFPCGVDLKRPNGQKAHQARRPVLVRDRIRAVGEPVAFVVAETLDAAKAAAELVVVETQDVPAVATVAAARASAGPAVWDEASDNIAFVWTKGDAGDAIARASHVCPSLLAHLARRGAFARAEGRARPYR